MKIEILERREKELSCDALILPKFEGEKPLYPALGREVGDLIKKIISSGEFKARHLDTCIVHTFGRIKPKRLILLGLGSKRDFTHERMRQCGGKVASLATRHGFRTLSISLGNLIGDEISSSAFLEGLILGSYRFGKYKKKEDSSKIEHIYCLAKKTRDFRSSLNFTQVLSNAVLFVRDLVNTPANEKTPSRLASIARKMKDGRIKVRVLNRKDMEREGMGSFLSVSRGSLQEPKFILLEYRGGEDAPFVLIGKCITFDSGGISLKPAQGMEKMKYDMAGGAAVLGVVKVLSELELPIDVIGILPATENLPSGSAIKPGDVVQTISGKSIEIINTDAEGRLTLADAIEYAKRFKPKAIIDVATLTGACSIALGRHAIAMMGNDDKLIKAMKLASDSTGEKVWHMPLFDEYREYLKSDIADLKNTGGRTGSLVTSGSFLKEFADTTPWIHLDIASTAWTDRERPYIPRGASGIGVRLLVHFLKEQIT
jgi:leucyl aminopeptidase